MQLKAILLIFLTTLFFALAAALSNAVTTSPTNTFAIAIIYPSPFADNRSTTTSLPIGTASIPLPSLATNFPPPVAGDAPNIEAIRNTLALYPFRIDGKNFAVLSNVFATDAVANYSAPLNVLTPLSNIESVLSSCLACVTTQHKFGLLDLLKGMKICE